VVVVFARNDAVRLFAPPPSGPTEQETAEPVQESKATVQPVNVLAVGDTEIDAMAPLFWMLVLHDPTMVIVGVPSPVAPVQAFEPVVG